MNSVLDVMSDNAAMDENHNNNNVNMNWVQKKMSSN